MQTPEEVKTPEEEDVAAEELEELLSSALSAADQMAAQAKLFDAFGVRLHGTVDETRFGEHPTAALANRVNASEALAWVNVAEEERPYKSPEQEYFESEWELPRQEMLYRWHGLGFGGQIERLYARPYIERMAERVSRRLDVAPLVDVTDPGYDAYFTNRCALLLDGLIEEELRVLYEQKEVDFKTVASAAGLQREEYFRAMTTKDRVSHAKILDTLFKLSQLAKGKATIISESRGGGGPMADLRAAVREVIAERDSIVEGAVVPALPVGTVEAEVAAEEAGVEVEARDWSGEAEQAAVRG